MEANQQGSEQDFLTNGYNWRTYGEMNVKFVEKHQNTSYETALKLCTKTHEEFVALAESLSNEELFSKGVFPWMGNVTLGSYFVSTTSSHYEWALKKIRKYVKSLK